MKIEFWLKTGSEGFRFPVNPAVNSYSSPFDCEDFEVEGIGQVTNIKRRGLMEFTLDTHFPAKYNPSYCGFPNIITPQASLDRLNKWRDKRLPVRYIVTGEGGVNVMVTIRDITVNANKSGELGDIYVTISLKEYRDYKVTTMDISKPTTNKPPNTSNRPSSPPTTNKVKTYVVKKNDSLWVISARKDIYGNGNKWRTIYNANKKVIGSNPNKLKIGQKLVIPR